MSALLTTAEVAERLALSEDWVRAHAAELGAVKLGQHRGALLRFDPVHVERWVDAHRINVSDNRPQIARNRASGNAENLIPIPADVDWG